jgi:NAD(P)H-dependent FMN reductase
VILALSGSLRRDSLNSAALRAAQTAVRSEIDVHLVDALESLPHFNPDLEASLPEPVERFRTTCTEADAVLLAVPEYAFGIPGAFKNALDWTVGSCALYRKPVAVLNVAPPGRGAHVQRSLELVFTALSCDVSWHHVPIHRSLLADSGDIRDERTISQLARVVEALAARRHDRSDGAEPALSA